MKDELEKLLIELLHRFDHEPDEITKYVVIDQTEFVPEALTSIINLVDKEVIGEDEIDSNFNLLMFTLPPYQRSIIYDHFTREQQQLITAEVREARINSEEWHLNRLIDLTNGFKTLDEVKTATHDRIKQLKSKEG